MHDASDVEEMRRAVADATATIPIRDVRRLDVRPGDTLVVRIPRAGFTTQSARSTEDTLRGLLDDGVRIVVAPDDIDITVLGKADS